MAFSSDEMLINVPSVSLANLRTKVGVVIALKVQSKACDYLRLGVVPSNLNN